MLNAAQSIMNKIVACRVCLNDKSRLLSIQNTRLQDVYEKLASTQLNTEDGRPQTVCNICHFQLQRCNQFMELSQTAERILSNLILNGIKFSQDAIIPLNGGIPLTMSCIQMDTHYDDTYLNDSIDGMDIMVKEEQTLKEESLCQEGNLLEVKREDLSAIACKRKRMALKIHNISKPNPANEDMKTKKCVKPEKRNINSKKHMKQIMLMNKGEKPYVCDRCSKAFSQMGNLNRHKRIHTGGKPYICDVCNKAFIEKVSLNSHKRIHTGEKLYSCEQCDKTFSQKCNLQRHERVHTGEKPFACDRCDKTFSDMSHVKGHMRIHTNEKPYACDRCGLRFSNVSNFKSHLRTHTGEKPYACNICFKTFPRSTTLKCHMIIHTGEKPYDCVKCNKKFNTSKYLKRHMRVHTGEKPYACDICDKTFTVKNSLKKHMQIHTGEKT